MKDNNQCFSKEGYNTASLKEGTYEPSLEDNLPFLGKVIEKVIMPQLSEEEMDYLDPL